MSEGWPLVDLSKIARVLPSNVDKKATPGERRVSLCNYLDVYTHDYITRDLPFMESTATENEIQRFGVRRGDVLVTKDSETPDDIGISAVVLDDIENLVCGYHLALLKPDENLVEPIYLAKQLGTRKITRYFANHASGSTRYGLTFGSLSAAQIPLASLTQQRLISELLRTLDETIDHTEALIEKMQQIKAGLMRDLFTRGISHNGQLRPPGEEAQQLYKESPLGWIPKEWDAELIGVLFRRRVERGRSGLPIMSITMNDGLVPRELLERRVDSRLKPEQHLLVKKGDIAYNMMRMWQGVLGRASYDCLVSPAYVVMEPTASIDSEFAELILSWTRSIMSFKRLSYGVVDDRLRLYARDLKRIPLAIPGDIAEQTRIAARISSLGDTIRSLARELLKRKLQKIGLSEDLLTGRVRVPESMLKKAASDV
jgi:type I restriction enzyme S subunit